MSQLSAFQNLLTQFLEELTQTFPELTDLRTILTLVTMMRSMNPRMILENFLEVAGRYHEKIFNEEASFFEDLENWKRDPYFRSEFAQSEIDETDMFQRLVVFRHVWKDLSASNKEHVWTYLKQLLVIGAKASKSNPELCKKILDCAIATRVKR
jgi:hypothetical protein